MVGDLRYPHGDAHDGSDDDTIEEGAFDLARHEHTAQHDGDDAKDGGRRELTERDECCWR